MSITRAELPAYELRWRQWGLPLLALLIVLGLMVHGGEEVWLRRIAAFGALCAVVCQLLEVIRDQYKLASEAHGQEGQARAFAQRAFHAKQMARLWGLLAIVTAMGAIAPAGRNGSPNYEVLVVAGILFVVGTVLLLAGRDVARHRPPTHISAVRLRLLGSASLLLAAVALAAAL